MLTIEKINAIVDKNSKSLYASPMSPNADLINEDLKEIIFENRRYIYKDLCCDEGLFFKDITNLSDKEIKKFDSFNFFQVDKEGDVNVIVYSIDDSKEIIIDDDMTTLAEYDKEFAYKFVKAIHEDDE